MVSALFLVAGCAIVVPVWALTYASHSTPSSWFGGGGRPFDGVRFTMFGRNAVLGFGATFIAGGLVGFALARNWWSSLALYAVGFFGLLSLLFVPCGYFWIFGVSAGGGVRNLIRQGRVRTAIRLVGIPLIAVLVASAVGLATYEERRPRWPGYRGWSDTGYFWVTPWWAYVGAVVLGPLGAALAVLMYRGEARARDRDLHV